MSTISLRTQIREEHLTCSICFNNFTRPKALPCLHTFCELCLRDYVVGRGFEDAGTFPCPVCRSTTKLPGNGVEGFPDNHLMASLSDTVEQSEPPRPVPKPRRSLGQPQAQAGGHHYSPMDVEEKETEERKGAVGGGDETSAEPPPAYSTVADTEPQHDGTGKICANDTDPGWMVVPKQTPSAPDDHTMSRSPADNVAEFCVVSVGHRDNGNPTGDVQPGNSIHIPGHPHGLGPRNPNDLSQPATANPSSLAYPNLSGLPGNDNPLPGPAIGWQIPSDTEGTSNLMPGSDNKRTINTHTPPSRPPVPSSQHPGLPLYPSVPQHVEYSSTSCSENLYLRFGKQGSSVRDFLKPIGLTISKEGYYIISDNGGDQSQNRIFIYNSGGELTTAFKTGCKVKDVAITRKNEILAAVHKNVSAIRHFTLAGQCKAEYGKFFTYEMPCGIAELKSGGAVLTGSQNHCVYILTNQMKLAHKFGRRGKGDGYFQHPAFTAVDSKDHVIITDKENHSVQVFNSEGKFKYRFGSEGSKPGQLHCPLGVCVDSNDNIIVADSSNFRVEVFTSKGRWLCSVVNCTFRLGENVKPVNVAVTPTGKVAVLLRGPYFAEVRVYASRHQQMSQEGPVSATVSSVWYTK